MVTRNKVIHRFVKNRDEYINETGAFYYQIIPENVQAYSIKFDPAYPNDYTKCKLYYVLGTGGSTYAEIARGEGKDITGNPTFSKEFLVSSENDIRDLIREYVQTLSGIVAYTYLDNDHKTIVLDNNTDSISGLDTEGNRHNLLLVSKKDIVEVGSKDLHLDLNTIDTITVNNKNIVLTTADPVVKYTEIDNKTTIQLNNNQSLSGLDTQNNNKDIVKISDKDIIEIGDTNSSININTENKVTINGTDTVATLNDLTDYATTTELNTKLDSNLGVANKDKLLVVDDNGEVTTTTLGLKNYDLSSQIDGNTVDFIVSDPTVDEFILFYNGLKQNNKTYTFTKATRIITTNFKPMVGETLDILYIKTK